MSQQSWIRTSFTTAKCKVCDRDLKLTIEKNGVAVAEDHKCVEKKLVSIPSAKPLQVHTREYTPGVESVDNPVDALFRSQAAASDAGSESMSSSLASPALDAKLSPGVNELLRLNQDEEWHIDMPYNDYPDELIGYLGSLKLVAQELEKSQPGVPWWDLVCVILRTEVEYRRAGMVENFFPEDEETVVVRK